jgi:hypothetical protein
MAILLDSVTQTTTINGNTPKFAVKRGECAALRSTGLSGSAVISLYYDGPKGTFSPSTFDDGTPVTLTPTNPERLINVPGVYRVMVSTISSTPGIVFVNQ